MRFSVMPGLVLGIHVFPPPFPPPQAGEGWVGARGWPEQVRP